MDINGKRFPLIGVWIEAQHGKPVTQAFMTAYVDDASLQAARSHALTALRHGATSASLRAYQPDNYGKDGTHKQGYSKTLEILDYRDLPENAVYLD